MATASWIPLTLVVCLMVSGSQVESADSLTCTVTRNGTVSSFTGETLSVGLPCHFRLAQFQVGHYKVQLTAGTDKKSETFSLSDLTLEVTDTETNKSMMTRTTQRRLKKEKRGKRVWLRPGGSLPDVILDFNDSLKAAIAKLPNGFQLTFTTDNVVLTVAAGCNLDLQPFPASLCGDGVTGNATSSAARALFGDGWETSLSALTHYSVLNADTISQEGACWCLRNQLQSCVNKSEAVKQCHPIFSEEGRMKCLNQSDMPLTDFYSDCLTSVCDGDTAVREDMNNHFSEKCPEYLATIPTTPTTPTTPTSPTTTELQCGPADCSANIFGSPGDTGNIQSPLYPCPYSRDNAYCVTRIQAPAGSTVTLMFDVFDINCDDRVRATEADFVTDVLPPTCGTSARTSVTSTGNIVNVILQVDAATTTSGSGYTATYTIN